MESPITERLSAKLMEEDDAASHSVTAAAAKLLNQTLRQLNPLAAYSGKASLEVKALGTSGHPRVDVDAFVVVR